MFTIAIRSWGSEVRLRPWGRLRGPLIGLRYMPSRGSNLAKGSLSSRPSGINDTPDAVEVNGPEPPCLLVPKPLRAVLFDFLRMTAQVRRVAVLELLDVPEGQPRAVDDAGVVLLVEIRDVASAEQGRDRAEVDLKPGAVKENGLLPHQPRQFLLQLQVNVERAVQEARSSREPTSESQASIAFNPAGKFARPNPIRNRSRGVSVRSDR